MRAEQPLPDPQVHDFAELAIEAPAGSDRASFIEGVVPSVVDQIRTAAAEKSVLSFDVFDTLLVRNQKCEAQRYQEWSAAVAASLSDEAAERARLSDEILLARVEGLRLSYRARPKREGCGEGSIHEVHRYIARTVGDRDALLETLLEQEIAYEAQNLSVNRTLLAAARGFVEAGGRVVLISDMYLCADDIRALATRLLGDDIGLFAEIYSSADHLFSKRSGRLFGLVTDDLGVASHECLHLGDSFEGDVFQARAAGWSALHTPISRTEILARTESLKAFIDQMGARGINVRSWAKI